MLRKIQILWKMFRNPFSHSLGLAYEKGKREQPREFKPRSFNTKVGRENGSGMTERKVVAMERSRTRPDFDHPTLVVTNDKRVLWVEPFLLENSGDVVSTNE